MAIGFNRGGGEQIAIGGQGQQWPTVSVHVVLQVKNFWKPRPGRLVLGPGTVGILCANEVFNSSLNALAIGDIERAQTHYRPGCLRGDPGLPALAWLRPRLRQLVKRARPVGDTENGKPTYRCSIFVACVTALSRMIETEAMRAPSGVATENCAP